MTKLACFTCWISSSSFSHDSQQASRLGFKSEWSPAVMDRQIGREGKPRYVAAKTAERLHMAVKLVV